MRFVILVVSAYMFLKNLFISFRPHQWIKNGFVFAALIFAVKFNDLLAIEKSLAAFALFCLASSGVYLFNDVIDYKADRKHPLKKNRPIASGHLSRLAAIFISVILISISVILSAIISYLLSLILVSYIILNIFYSLYLKNLVILDVICIALGFVLRVIAGAVVISVPFSIWLLLCTFFLALFLVIGKRKNELLCLGINDGSRPVMTDYSIDLLNQMSAVVFPSTLITYTLYTFSSWHSQWLVITVPIVLYGLFRYLYIVDRKRVHDNGPTDDLIYDRSLQLTVLIWVILVGLILIKFN